MSLDTTTYQYINLGYLTNLAGGDVVFLVEVINDYLTKEPENFTALSAAVGAESYPNIQYYAHKLRSAVQMVGAKELLSHLEKIELLAAAKDAEALTIFKDIPRINEQVLLELRQELNNLHK